MVRTFITERCGKALKKKGRTAKITSPLDAESRARQVVGDRYPSHTVKRILFKSTIKEGNLWWLDGEVLVKWLRFFTARKSFRLQISAGDGELISYEETR